MGDATLRFWIFEQDNGRAIGGAPSAASLEVTEENMYSL